MIDYTMNENVNVAVGGLDVKISAESQKTISLKRIQGGRDQQIKPKDTFTESTDSRLMSGTTMQEAFRALAQLMLYHRESKQLSEEIIKVYTEMLQVDGICIYTGSAEGTLDVLACNVMWSNVFSTLQVADEVEGQDILLNPAVFFTYPASSNTWEKAQPSKVIPLSVGMRQYGAIISLPLVCDGTTVGAISLFSVHPQFFTPERIEVLQTAAGLTASLYLQMSMKSTLEKEQSERIILQKDLQMLRGQMTSNSHTTDASIEVDAAYEELEALSYSVSHDLRGPIIAIQNCCEWLAAQYTARLDAEGNSLVQQIAVSSDHMAKLLDGLLAFSRVVQLDPQKTCIDMTALVQSVIDELLKCETVSSSLSIAVQPLMPAYGDAVLMRQVWHNLISNAFKYTRYKQKREVVIDSHPFNGGAKYCVSDNGIGFDMQYVDRLFGAFHRLHVAEEFEGTGVGLAIVQRIVRRHGGQVWAEGKVDNGARFYFTLPKI
jgi:signal transduction histidine kinase